MDDTQNKESNILIAWVVGGAAALAVAVSLIFAFVAAFGPGSTGTRVATAAEQSAAIPLALVEVDQPPPLATGSDVPALVKFHFDTGKTELPADAPSQVQALVVYLRVTPDAKLCISGFHDKSGDPAMNRELAKNRALATHAMLVSAGVPADRLVLVRPQETDAGAGVDDRDARRVEVFPSR